MTAQDKKKTEFTECNSTAPEINSLFLLLSSDQMQQQEKVN